MAFHYIMFCSWKASRNGAEKQNIRRQKNVAFSLFQHSRLEMKPGAFFFLILRGRVRTRVLRKKFLELRPCLSVSVVKRKIEKNQRKKQVCFLSISQSAHYAAAVIARSI
ncbi:hypothetical protein OUZ56_001296 [Daphnia magna]|uniref:Uncharacterized protein n=1 Tax=Daphnia magna TaxID=35525 RepID=A0ABR0A2T4_9CRUS|nr:hypothetical protein OUZ56_001296 [Daphnia magna]